MGWRGLDDLQPITDGVGHGVLPVVDARVNPFDVRRVISEAYSLNRHLKLEPLLLELQHPGRVVLKRVGDVPHARQRRMRQCPPDLGEHVVRHCLVLGLRCLVRGRSDGSGGHGTLFGPERVSTGVQDAVSDLRSVCQTGLGELARPDRPKASLIGGRPFRVRTSTEWTSFLARVALPHQLSAARQAPAQRPRLLIRQPAAMQQPGGEQPRERARVAAVGLDLGLGDRPQLRPSRHHDPSHVRLQPPGDRERVAGWLQRHLIVGAEAVGQDLQPFEAGRHATPDRTRPASQIATSQKSRCTSNPTNRTQSPFARHRSNGEKVGKRQERIRAHGTTGRVAGAATEVMSGSQPSQARPAQPTFSQKPLTRCARRYPRARTTPPESSPRSFIPGGCAWRRSGAIPTGRRICRGVESGRSGG